ncbi:MAG: TRAP transporter small permease subunit [Deltaproteobacteria bacterium]|nr:TRAP transporter small permease subunit [Deltaproteobacteria bacterium]
MNRFIRLINSANQVIGTVSAPLTLVITGLVLLEVTARYLFNSPTTWANEVNQYLLCALVMFGGGYTLSKYSHTRVDILHVRFPQKYQALVEIFIGACVFIIAAPIFWYGSMLTVEAFHTGQTSVSAAELPLWPSMATVPLGALFLGLQALSNALEALGTIRSAHGTHGKEAPS